MARRSPASCASPAARRGGRGSGPWSRHPPSPTRPIACTPSHQASGAELEISLVDGADDDRDDQGDLRDPRRDPDGRRHRRRATRRHHRRPRPAAQHEQRQAGDGRPRCRPTCRSRVEAWGALDRLIWQDVDSNQLDAASSSTALRGWVAGGGRLDHRRRDGRTIQPVGVPRRPPALSPDDDDRCRTLVPRGAARRAARRTRRTCRPCPGSSPRAGRSRRSAGRRWPPNERMAPARSRSSASIRRRRWLTRHERRRRPLAAADPDPVRGYGGDRRRQPDRPGGVAAAVARPAAGRRPHRPARSLLHPADRADQLPRPQAARQARMGVGDDAGADRRLRGRSRTASGHCSAAATSSSMRPRSSAAPRAPPRASPRRISASSHRPAASYQLRIPGGALLSSPTNGDFIGDGTAASLDVLQGDPSRVRDLGVGFGSLRTIRAESAVTTCRSSRPTFVSRMAGCAAP